MKLCRFETSERKTRIGLIAEGHVLVDLSAGGIPSLNSLFEASGAELTNLAKQNLPQYSLADVRLLAPVERQEVWAVGVTYLRSKKARMEE